MKNLLVLLLLITVLTADAQITFQKTFGSGGNDHGSWVRQTSDSGYIFVGGGFNVNGNGGALIVKTNYYGNILWSNVLDSVRITVVEQTNDGGYILGGTTTDNLSNLALVRMSSAGSILWSKRYSGYIATGNSVLETSTGEFLIAGYLSTGLGTSNIFLIKTNAVGDVIWSKITGTSHEDKCKSIANTNDGGYIITGEMPDTNGFGQWIYLMKLNSTGSILWKKTYFSSINIISTYGNHVEQTLDNGYFVLGNAFDINLVDDAFLIKMDSLGNPLWSKTYEGSYKDRCQTGTQTSDGGFILGINTRNSSSGEFNIAIVKTDTIGELIWSKLIGQPTGDESVSCIQQTNDEGYILIGDKYYLSTDNEVYLIKTDSSGNSGCNEAPFFPNVVTHPVQAIDATIFDSSGTIASNIIITPAQFSGTSNTLCSSLSTNEILIETSVFLSPNPATDFTVISAPFKTGDELTVTDVLGKTLFRKTVESPTSNIQLQTSGFASGIYFVKVGNAVRKFLKQ